MTSEMYTSNPDFCACASLAVWMKEDSLQYLGPEEQNQTADNFCFPHGTTIKKKETTNIIKRNYLKFRQVKPIEKEYLKKPQENE